MAKRDSRKFGRNFVSSQIVLFGKYIDDSGTKEEVIGELEALKIYIERILRAGVYLEG